MSFLSSRPTGFLQSGAWQHQKINALQYNTSMAGSVVALVYGRVRQPSNLIEFDNYRGPKGKKGKVGPLPVTGAPTGKGGGGGKKSKKNTDFSVDVAFGVCQGPATILPGNFVFASGSVAAASSVGLLLYDGSDGQPIDPTFAAIHGADALNYSGTLYVAGTPMDLGSSPVLPNISFEVEGILSGTAGPDFPGMCDPSLVVVDFLSNLRYGAGFPLANIDPDIQPIYGDYCIATQMVICPILDTQTKAADWLEGLAKLTNTAIVWSGTTLKFIPYGDLTLAGHGVTWTPNLIPAYSFTDDHFLPWRPHQEGSAPQAGEDDPIIITRTNPADAINWLTIEYLDRDNFYNPNTLPVFDQGLTDLYGHRSGDNLQGHCFVKVGAARTSAQLVLQRLGYLRNTYKFQIGWQFSLLEPMDIVLLTETISGLNQQPVRVTAIEENDNGDLTVTAEQIESQIWPGVPASISGVAWSVRLVNPSYAGPLYKLRRDSDDATQDFLPDVNGNSDVAAVLAFLGGANGFFDTWYDQGPSGLHVHNATFSGQPQWIASANAGWPGAQFSGANALGSGAAGPFPPSTALATFVVAQMPLPASWNTFMGNQVNLVIRMSGSHSGGSGIATFGPMTFAEGATAGFGSVFFSGVDVVWNDSVSFFSTLLQANVTSFDTSYHLWDTYDSNSTANAGDAAENSSTLSQFYQSTSNNPGTPVWLATVTMGGPSQFVGTLQEIQLLPYGSPSLILAARGAKRADMSAYFSV